MKQLLVVLALLVVGCAGAPKQATIGGSDLYARASELREQGHVTLTGSNQKQIDVRLEHYLIDRSRDQIFHVREVVAGCYGNSMAEDTDCTVALMQSQRFVVSDRIPAQKKLPGENKEDISDINKARLVMVAAGAAMAYGAAKCEVFEGCGGLLAIGAGADALLLLITYTGMR